MKTEHITDPRRAAELLSAGALVALPTETVYGLAGNALDSAAVEAIYAVKGRPAVKPLSLLVPDAEALERWCSPVPPAARALADAFWPGPLTLVLRSRGREAALVRAGGEGVGLRCPDHPLTLEVLRAGALPLAAPSANPSGAPSPKTAAEAAAYFDGKIAAVLDGGPCALGRESTVIDLDAAPFRVLRRGALDETALFAVLRDSLTLVGLTGGSGCGKTTALRVLAEMGALVLDADRIYHGLTRSDPALRREITERFGPVYTDGVLDRRRLAETVFADPEALAALNAVTHKYVLAEIDRRLTEHALAGGTLAAVDAVALVESGLGARAAFTVAVTAPAAARAARIALRDGLTPEQAGARIAAQKPDSWYEANCAFVLRNDAGKAAFEDKCRTFFTEVLTDYGGTGRRGEKGRQGPAQGPVL